MTMFDCGPLAAVLAAATGEGRIVGAVAAVAHRGSVHLRAAGFADREEGLPMSGDALFRLASLSKVVVSVAALALAEQGAIELDGAVTDWLPWFIPRLPSGRAPKISLRHLLTHSAGLGYSFGQPGGGAYRAAGISDGLDDSGLTLDENLRRLGSVPLLHRPGEAWTYSLATDVLGAVLERAAGRPLADLIAELVVQPLGLASIGFVAAPDAVLATPYGDGKPVPQRMGANFALPFGESSIRYSPGRAYDGNAYPSGGTGLVGTAADFLAFLEAIRMAGAPILSPESAAALTTNAVGDRQVGLPGSGLGWGLGVAIVRDPAVTGSPLGAGSWQWGGVYGHSYWVDPAAELSAVLLTNTAIAGMAGPFPDAVKRAVYEGLRA